MLFPDESFLKAMPKADIHVHLDGAVRPATIIDLARACGHPLPTFDPDGLASLVAVKPGCSSLAEFLAGFEIFYPVLKGPGALERIAFELVEDEASDGVRYVEARFAPVLQAGGKFTIRQAAEAAARGLEAGARKAGVAAGLILCAYRSESPASSVETVEAAIALLGRGVVGVDLAGDERNFKAAPHVEAFRVAREAGIPATVHAGEDGPAENVAEAVFLLGARRIGHAIRLADDRDLLDCVVSEGVAIEACLTSNLRTGMVRSIEEHPAREFISAGARVTINTDDPSVCKTSLSSEFALAVREFCLDASAVKRIAMAGFEASFVDEAAKSAMRRDCEEWFDEHGC